MNEQKIGNIQSFIVKWVLWKKRKYNYAEYYGLICEK